MKIRFETTIDDVIAFQRYHFANSPAWRRQVWTQCAMLPGILLGIMLITWLTRNDGMAGQFPVEDDGPIDPHSYFLGATFLIVSIVWAIGIRWYMYWSLERNTRRFLAEGSNRVMFGWREMELVNNRLVLDTELIHSSLDLRAIEKIVGNERYTYVYIAAAQAYLIPMDLYPEDEYRQFVTELREAWENRDAPRPVEEEASPIPYQADERIVERPH